jgi:hypothetical protein
MKSESRLMRTDPMIHDVSKRLAEIVPTDPHAIILDTYSGHRSEDVNVPAPKSIIGLKSICRIVPAAFRITSQSIDSP